MTEQGNGARVFGTQGERVALRPHAHGNDLFN